LDNAVKHVLNGLGPIIGYRQDWQKRDIGPARDSAIVELVVEKNFTSCNRETVEVTVEEVPPTQYIK
jgi:hypothetical protein